MGSSYKHFTGHSLSQVPNLPAHELRADESTHGDARINDPAGNPRSLLGWEVDEEGVNQWLHSIVHSMVRRSRGCQECKKRRIGCDGASPACRQCLITNRSCSGPIQGTMIIDQTAAVNLRYTKTARQRQRPASVIRQPSSRAIASTAYVSEFMLFFNPATGTPSNPPLLCVLEDLSADERGPALDISLQAAATAYCGVASKNSATVMEACSMYGKALSRQSAALSHGSEKLSTFTICTTVLLSIFEILWSTSASAYVSHLSAARRMLGLASSELAQTGLVGGIAIFIKYQSLFAMIIAPAEYFATVEQKESWNDMSRYKVLGMPGVTDRLLGQLYLLGELFGTNSGTTDISIHINDINCVLDELWAEFQHDLVACSGPARCSPAAEAELLDGPAAITVAYFASARILSYLVQHKRRGDPSREVEEHGQAILQCSAVMAKGKMACVSIRMFFPIAIVALYSTSHEQRGMARNFLGGWVRITAFTGLCKIVEQRIRSACV